MLKHNLSSALRSLVRQRLFTVVNLVGLTVGLASSLLIFAYAQEELSYDRAWPQADRLMRLYSVDSTGGQVMRSAVVLGQSGPRIVEAVAGVESFVRVHNERVVLKGEDRPFEERSGFAWTDAAVFDLFGLRLRHGDPTTALSAPGAIVLTPDLARKLFGDADPMGRTVRLDATENLFVSSTGVGGTDESVNYRDMSVTGVLEPVEGPTHLQLTALGSYSTLEPLASPWVSANQGWTYLRLSPDADRSTVEAAINRGLDQVVTWFDLSAMNFSYGLQPVVDIRLRSGDLVGAGPVADIRTVWLVSAIGLLVLLMACVNFMNLAGARGLRRSREIGVRKSLGATRTQVILQLLQESVGMSVLALGLSLTLIQLVLPLFNDISGSSIGVAHFMRPDVAAATVLITLLSGLVAGSYPAHLLSSSPPARALRGIGGQAGRSWFRRGLVVFQFAVSAALIMATLVIRAQLGYVQGADAGFDPDGLLVLRTHGLEADPVLLRDALETLPGVEGVSIASGLPLGGAMQSTTEIDGQTYMLHYLFADEQYVRVTGLQMAAGRWYDRNRPGDAVESIVVNETYARLQGWDDAVGRQLPNGTNADGSPNFRTVVGVVKDFHTGSLHEAISPAQINSGTTFPQFARSILVRLEPGARSDHLSGIESTWARFVPERPLSYYFADDIVRFMYDAEARLGRVLLVFTVLAMLIAGLGLFGLAAYSAEQRTREIGIRKALGASSAQIAGTLSGEFMRLTLAALVVGIPIALGLTSRWLETFAYHVDVGPGLVLTGCGAVAALMLLSVSGQAMRAARLDPVESLRQE